MSTLVTNTITGLSTAANITIGSTPVVSASANSLTIRGEGSAQTSVQQGLSKAWFNVDGTGTIAIRDSFNLTSVTDDGTGIIDFAIANDMANDDYDFQSSTGNYHARSIDLATGTGEIRMYNTSHASVDADAFINLHGDLA